MIYKVKFRRGMDPTTDRIIGRTSLFIYEEDPDYPDFLNSICDDDHVYDGWIVTGFLLPGSGPGLSCFETEGICRAVVRAEAIASASEFVGDIKGRLEQVVWEKLREIDEEYGADYEDFFAPQGEVH